VTEINPGEFLASPEIEYLVDVMRDVADVVIVDSPPVLPVADTPGLAAMGLPVALLVESGRTRRQEAKLATDILLRARARVIGTVLNRAPKQSTLYYPYATPIEVASKEARSQEQLPAARLLGPSTGSPPMAPGAAAS
jgi:Mrp family chromosome partitioning ATPase